MRDKEIVRAMQCPPPAVAAWLIKSSPRVLRDHPEIPRNPDGTYNARALVDYAVCERMAAVGRFSERNGDTSLLAYLLQDKLPPPWHEKSRKAILISSRGNSRSAPSRRKKPRGPTTNSRCVIQLRQQEPLRARCSTPSNPAREFFGGAEAFALL